jgi:ATP-binding cassette subfamily B protein
MDSWSESDWFKRFRQLIKNRTAVVITHRFTIAMRADIIFVMDQGKIVESGTHGELIKFDGLYAKSWKEQMRAAENPGEINDQYEIFEDNPASLESLKS